MYKILIIEDDLTIASTLKNSLIQWGYDATYVSNFKQVIESFNEIQPHLVLLDITLPYCDGYHWGREIRKISNVPIIFISSLSDNMNVVMAIRMGGDDFISKPFDINIVIAKIEALLRRTYMLNGTSNVITLGCVTLDLNKQELTNKDVSIELTKNEFKIIQILMENLNKIISRDAIMTRLWETDSFIDDNTLTVNVTRLRKKLSEIGLKDLIQTKKGQGYMVGNYE